MHIQTYKRFICLLFLVLLLTACGAKDDILGKWRQEPCTSYSSNLCNMEFFNDGTISIGGITAKYIWVDDKRMKAELPGIPISIVHSVNIGGDTLTFTPELQGQQPQTFRRNK